MSGTPPAHASRPGRRAAIRAAAVALLAAVPAACARPVAPLAALEPGQSPMVTGQSPGTSFTDGSKEAPFSSQASYPPGAASSPGRGP